ncbi:MAG: DNA primase [Syntrophobacteraceae bacterium]
MSASDIATLVKQAVDIVDVIGQVVPLRRNGNRHLGLCPFHQEKTPSFQVDAGSQFYHCFGCGSGGDVLSFVMKHQNLSFGEAVEYLAERYHIALPQKDPTHSSPGSVTEASRKEREQLYRILQEAADFFYKQLHHGEPGKIARDYLSKRRLPPHIVETERIGYAPNQWDSLRRHLEHQGIDPELGVKAGLLSKGAKDRIFDRFRNRLIFPIMDEREHVVAFGGRSLAGELPGAGNASASDGQNEPKYLNSPETPIYHKGRMLYQLAKARDACRKVRQTIVVEGYMDLLAFHAQGFYRVVATLGTALTLHQVRLLSRMCDEVVLAYDADEAGEKAILRALPLFLQEELAVTCLRFPEGMDPDDFLKASGLEGFETLLQKRNDLGVYVLEKGLNGWDGTSSGKARVLAELQPVLEAVRQPVLKSEYSRLLAERLSLSETVIERQVQHGKRSTEKYSRPFRQAPLPKTSQNYSLEENILRLMIKYPDLIEEVKSFEAVEYFEQPRLKAVAEVLLRTPHPPENSFDAAAVYDLLEESEQKELFTKFLLESGDLSDARVQLHDWLEALRSAKTRSKRFGSLNEALLRAQHEGDATQIKVLLAQLQSLYSVKKGAKKHRKNVEGDKNR